MAVKVRIDEIVLHGFDARERHAIDDRIREELTRLFTEDPPQADEQSVAVAVSAAIRRGVTR